MRWIILIDDIRHRIYFHCCVAFGPVVQIEKTKRIPFKVFNRFIRSIEQFSVSDLHIKYCGFWLSIQWQCILFNTEHLLYQNQKNLTIKVCILCLKKCAVHLQLTFDRGVYQLKLNRLKSHPMIMVNNNAMLSIFITSKSTSLGTLSVWVMVVSKMNANDFLNCFFPKGSIVTFKMIHMNRWKR